MADYSESSLSHPSSALHAEDGDEQRTEAGLARRRLLDVAELLFMRRGYSAISLRDIADALGIKQASLYYHFPGGKEEIYVAVAERAFARHHEGMCAALADHTDIQAQLEAVAAWFATQPHMCLMGMVHADLPALHPAGTETVTAAAARGLFEPLVTAFAAAQARGEVRPMPPPMLAGAFLALLDGATIAHLMGNAADHRAVTNALISILLNGVRQSAHAA
ncbi:MAG: TetR/AcrR family transcriptional regulator [Caldilineaceae bacterium]